MTDPLVPDPPVSDPRVPDPLGDDRLALLAAELGALAAACPGVQRVQARPGVGSLVRGAVEGLTAVVAGPGGGADASSSAVAPVGGRPVPLVALAVADAETRVTLDIAVGEGARGPAVAREVAARLLERMAAEPLPPASVDVRIVGLP
jgi:hypothetical protein